MDLIKEFIRDYFVIFGVLIIGSVILTPPDTINRDYVLLAMAFAAIGNLPSIMFWSKVELSESSRRLRSIIHFMLVLSLMLIFGVITGVVTELEECFILAIEIIIVYGVVKFIVYQGDISTATTINEKLKKLRETDE